MLVEIGEVTWEAGIGDGDGGRAWREEEEEPSEAEDSREAED